MKEYLISATFMFLTIVSAVSTLIGFVLLLVAVYATFTESGWLAFSIPLAVLWIIGSLAAARACGDNV